MHCFTTFPYGYNFSESHLKDLHLYFSSTPYSFTTSTAAVADGLKAVFKSFVFTVLAKSKYCRNGLSPSRLAGFSRLTANIGVAGLANIRIAFTAS